MNSKSTNSSEDQDQQWTFVSTKNKKKKSKKYQKQIANAKMFQTILSNGDDDDDDNEQQNDSSCISEEECTSLSQCIEHCMKELQYFNTTTTYNDNNSTASTKPNHHTGPCKSNKNNRQKMTFHFQSLLTSLQKASSYTTTETDTIGKETTTIKTKKIKKRTINEIVCYGIGNFAMKKRSSSSLSSRRQSKSSKYHNGNSQQQQKQNLFDSSSSPMIQLACILLIRQRLAMHITLEQQKQRENQYPTSEKELNDLRGTNSENKDASDIGKGEEVKEYHQDHHNPTFVSYKDQQRLVPMVYFEPFIKPIETKVLKEIFHVQVLDLNEQGKRCVINNSNSDSNNGDNETETQTQTQKDGNRDTDTDTDNTATLFYMPHCPMRLYSNVLWANWTNNLNLLLNGRIIILGNSFKAYDDRIVSSEQRRDTTNAIFPLLPFVKEENVFVSHAQLQSQLQFNDGRVVTPSCESSVFSGSSTGLYLSPSLSWLELEKAFNDSVITSFSNPGRSSDHDHKYNNDDNNWPVKPDEHIASDYTDGEVV